MRGLADGSSYDPDRDRWRLLPGGGPTRRSRHTAVWTGDRMIVWGGSSISHGYPVMGGVYDPRSGQWTDTSLPGAPTGRAGHTAVWTGESMLIWGGGNGSYFRNGGRYIP